MKYLCPGCNSLMELPACSECGHHVTIKNDVWQMTDMPNMNIDGENKYIGYDNIGEHFEPERIYNDDIQKYRVYDTCSKKIVELFGTNITVLDLGAGLGSAAIPLAKYGASIIAVDISQNMLELLIKRLNGKNYKNLDCCRMNAYELLIPDESVDIVIENAMLHLVDNPELIIKEIVRVLKPSGKLIRYGTFGIPADPARYANNDYCNKALSDISQYYADLLKQKGFEDMWFDNNYHEVVKSYFKEPYNETTDLTEEFTEKMKLRIHRLEHKAHSGYQHIPNSIHEKVWAKTDIYAKEKYGQDYREIPNYSKYSSCIDVYTKKQGF